MAGGKLTVALLSVMLFAAAGAAVPAAAEEPFCYECHDEWPEVAHPHEPVANGECTECHEDHGDAEKLMLVEEGGALCYQCHDDKGGGATVHPPVEDGECTECHNPHGSENTTLLRMLPEELCFECHDRDESGFSEQLLHGAVEEGCLECHNPHSSSYPRLLVANYVLARKWRFDESRAELCFNCHDSESFTAVETEDTGFRHGKKNLHAHHLRGGVWPDKYGIVKKKNGLTCFGCHLPHSSSQDRLIRNRFRCGDIDCYAIKYTPSDQGGTCTVGCHKTRSYSRDNVKETAGTGAAAVPIDSQMEKLNSLKKAIEVEPERSNLHLQLGLLFFDRQQYEEALVEFTRALTLEPNQLAAHHFLVDTLEMLGRSDEEEEARRRYRELLNK